MYIYKDVLKYLIRNIFLKYVWN